MTTLPHAAQRHAAQRCCTVKTLQVASRANPTNLSPEICTSLQCVTSYVTHCTCSLKLVIAACVESLLCKAGLQIEYVACVCRDLTWQCEPKPCQRPFSTSNIGKYMIVDGIHLHTKQHDIQPDKSHMQQIPANVGLQPIQHHSACSNQSTKLLQLSRVLPFKLDIAAP